MRRLIEDVLADFHHDVYQFRCQKKYALSGAAVRQDLVQASVLTAGYIYQEAAGDKANLSERLPCLQKRPMHSKFFEEQQQSVE
ncbi:hypothetical protein ABBQ38_013614 [Trebouxia sp. C0009 RCD-2024]